MNISRRRRSPALIALLAASIVLTTRGTDAQPASNLPRLAAQYIETLVDGLSIMVAEEDFTFKGKRVLSDLLLVRHPGSDRHLLPFRDVSHLNGTPLPGRDLHRADLFFQSNSDVSRLAFEIAMDSDAYVPAVLNPLFAVAFLQLEYQSRFRLAEKDAGRDWPSTVKALTFEETAKPTLLRGGDAKSNAPARGTAWIDTATGLVLQTQIEVRFGRTVTTMVTRYGYDERLQMMVPIEMRTKNPDGLATYSNFRRWAVEIDELVHLPMAPR